MFSAITSPAFSELAVALGNDDIDHLPSDVTLFETLRMMHDIRPFKLVFLLELRPFPAEGVEERRKLVEVLRFAMTSTRGFLNSPLIVRRAF